MKKRKRCCRVSWCKRRDIKAHGYCKKHYLQICNHGEILKRTMYDSNEIIDYGDYIGIILYNKMGVKVAETLADKSDMELLKKYKWHYKGYSISGYAVTKINKQCVKMQHILFPEHFMTDHRNRDKLDNRRCNLRECSLIENMRNRGTQKNNISGVAGVHFCNSQKRWIARIKINSKIKNLGQFFNFSDAVKIRKEAERKHFGEFAPI